MTAIPVYTLAGQPAGEFELATDVFGVEPNAALVHQSVVATLANRRQGTADTKTRGEVHHSTRKLWKQKGTGRARQGMRSAPHWKGGGVAFGPHPRDYTMALTKKMRRKALLSALTVKAAANSIMVVQAFDFTAPKTKQAVAILNALSIADKKVLLVMNELQDAVVLSFRNLPNVLITSAALLGTYDALNADVLLFTEDSLRHLQELKQQPLGSARWIAKQQGGAA